MQLTIEQIEHKTTKAGKPYVSIFSPGVGWASCFEPVATEWASGQTVEINHVATKEGNNGKVFKNIKLTPPVPGASKAMGSQELMRHIDSWGEKLAAQIAGVVEAIRTGKSVTANTESDIPF